MVLSYGTKKSIIFFLASLTLLISLDLEAQVTGLDKAVDAQKITDASDPFSPYFRKQGQENDQRQGFYVSAQGGLTIANMAGEDVSDNTYLIKRAGDEGFYANEPSSSSFLFGYNFQTELLYRFSNIFSQGLGVSYVQKGAAINVDTYRDSKGEVFPLTGDIVWLQNYLSINLPFSIYFPVSEYQESYIKLGLFFAHLLEAREEGKIEIQGISHTYSNDLGGNLWERGFFLGVGYTYFLTKNKGSIFIEAVWSKSQTAYGIESAGVPGVYYNQAFNFNLGYSYIFGQNWF